MFNKCSLTACNNYIIFYTELIRINTVYFFPSEQVFTLYLESISFLFTRQIICYVQKHFSVPCVEFVFVADHLYHLSGWFVSCEHAAGQFNISHHHSHCYYPANFSSCKYSLQWFAFALQTPINAALLWCPLCLQHILWHIISCKTYFRD